MEREQDSQIRSSFKLFYNGVGGKKNAVAMIPKEEMAKNVLEVKQVSDRVMSLKLVVEGVMSNVASNYAPQEGCELEKEENSGGRWKRRSNMWQLNALCKLNQVEL